PLIEEGLVGGRQVGQAGKAGDGDRVAFAPRPIGFLVLRKPVEPLLARGGNGFCAILGRIIRAACGRRACQQQPNSEDDRWEACHRELLLGSACWSRISTSGL